jgi:hypothetical protein
MAHPWRIPFADVRTSRTDGGPKATVGGMNQSMYRVAAIQKPAGSFAHWAYVSA